MRTSTAGYGAGQSLASGKPSSVVRKKGDGCTGKEAGAVLGVSGGPDEPISLQRGPTQLSSLRKPRGSLLVAPKVISPMLAPRPGKFHPVQASFKRRRESQGSCRKGAQAPSVPWRQGMSD